MRLDKLTIKSQEAVAEGLAQQVAAKKIAEPYQKDAI